MVMSGSIFSMILVIGTEEGRVRIVALLHLIYLHANFKEQFESFSFIPSPAVEKFMQFALAFEVQTYFGNTARIQ